MMYWITGIAQFDFETYLRRFPYRGWKIYLSCRGSRYIETLLGLCFEAGGSLNRNVYETKFLKPANPQQNQ